MRRTVIDIGTNTILMLIADFDEVNQTIKPLIDIQEIPRLGKGVDNARNILPESIEKAIKIIKEYKEISNRYNSKKITAAATSFLRDSHNKKEFINAVYENTGIKTEILSGQEEARWTFIGGIHDKFIIGNSEKRFMTVDIGGGSTEITTGKIMDQFSPKNIKALKITGKSFDIGSVRIKEKFITSHPPENTGTENAEKFIMNQFSDYNIIGKYELIGVAGTITTLGAVKLGLENFIPEKVHGLELTLHDIRRLLNSFSEKTIDELYQSGKYMEGRADIIFPGTLILKCFMEKFNIEKLTISTTGLRYGILMREMFNLSCNTLN